MTTIIAAGAISLVLAGCGDAGRATTGGERNRMVQACLAETNMGRPICECVAETASNELTPSSFDMLLATFEDDDGRANQLRSQLSLEEMTASSMFMVSAPAQCARSLNEG